MTEDTNKLNHSHSASWLRALCSGLLVFTPLAAGASEYEKLTGYRASDVVPPAILTSDEYTIDEEVGHNGYLYQYVIRSRFGNFEVQGDSLLRARTHELRALAELEKNSEVGIVVDAAVDSLVDMGTSPFELAGSLAARPVETVTGIPAGVGRWFSSSKRKVEGATKSAKAGGVDETAKQATQYGEQWLGVDDAELRWAAKLEVDPYSTNQVLNQSIKEVARYDASTRKAVKLAVPSVEAIEALKNVNDLVWKLDAHELRKRDTERLVAAGADPEVIEAFYGIDWYSPTLQTVLVSAVLSMENVPGRQVIFEKLPAVGSEVEARFVTESVALASRAHAHDGTLVSVSDAATMPMGVTEAGRFTVYLALDHVVWTEEVAQGFAPFMEVARDTGGDMFFTGTLSHGARAALNNAGWRTHERVSFADDGG